jgi:hypothetical protein
MNFCQTKEKYSKNCSIAERLSVRYNSFDFGGSYGF